MKNDVGAVYEGVNELEEREFPSLAKEGCREAAGVSGANASPIGRSNEERFDQEINYWTNTTPALRATPPLLRRGISLVCQFIHTFYDRAYKERRQRRLRPMVSSKS